MNYFTSGKYNLALQKAFSYDKKKKELLEKKEDNNETRKNKDNS